MLSTRGIASPPVTQAVAVRAAPAYATPDEAPFAGLAASTALDRGSAAQSMFPGDPLPLKVLPPRPRLLVLDVERLLFVNYSPDSLHALVPRDDAARVLAMLARSFEVYLTFEESAESIAWREENPSYRASSAVLALEDAGVNRLIPRTRWFVPNAADLGKREDGFAARVDAFAAREVHCVLALSPSREDAYTGLVTAAPSQNELSPGFLTSGALVLLQRVHVAYRSQDVRERIARHLVDAQAAIDAGEMTPITGFAPAEVYDPLASGAEVEVSARALPTARDPERVVHLLGALSRDYSAINALLSDYAKAGEVYPSELAFADTAHSLAPFMQITPVL